MRYGLVCIRRLVEECAYYKWLNGSADATRNWVEAEAEVLTRLGIRWDL